MATAGLTCPGCGSKNIVDDQLYSQPQLVCEDCGAVISDGLLTTTASEELQGTNIDYCYTTAVNKQPCRNLIKGLQRLRAFCRILRLKIHTEQMSETFYKQAYNHPDFIKVSLQKKEALVGCCVLVSCRLCNWPICMGSICSLLESDPELLGVVYLQMMKSLKINAPSTPIVDMLESHCQEYKLLPEHVSKGLSEDIRLLTKRSMFLLELAAETWIVTGRQPVPMMIACTFLAWQSLRPTRERLRYTVNKFCQMAKITRNYTASKRVRELKKVLVQLGQEIPWLRVEVTLANVMQHVDDIVENQSELLRRAMRSYQESLQDDPQQDDLQQGDPQQGDPQLDDPQQDDLQQGDPQQSEPQQSDLQQGDPQQSEPQQSDLQQGDPQQDDLQQSDLQQGDPQQSDPQPYLQETPPGEHTALASQEGTAPAQTSRDPEHPPPQPGLAACEPDGERAQGPSDMDPTAGANEQREEEGISYDCADTEQFFVPVETWSKQHLFVPPCIRHPRKRRRTTVNPMVEVTGDEDISDSEINVYIRTPQEVREFAKTKATLSEEEEE